MGRGEGEREGEGQRTVANYYLTFLSLLLLCCPHQPRPLLKKAASETGHMFEIAMGYRFETAIRSCVRARLRLMFTGELLWQSRLHIR